MASNKRGTGKSNRNVKSNKPSGKSGANAEKVTRGTGQNQQKNKSKGSDNFGKRVRRAFATLKKEIVSSNSSGSAQKAVFVLAAVIIVVAASLIITNKNAYSVIVAGEEVSVIKKDKKLTPQGLLDEAVIQIETKMGTAIKVNEEVKFEPSKISKKEMQSPDMAINRIAAVLTYDVEAVAIKVEGTTMAIVKNRREAEEIENELISPYLQVQDGVKIVEKVFVENYSTETVYVTPDDITGKSKALEILTTTTPSLNTYTVSHGDNLYSIAAKVDMSVEEILGLNPDYSINSTLYIGDQLTIRQLKPLLSVKIVAETTLTEVVEKPEIKNNNPLLPRGQFKSVQYGSDGQADVTYQITRINGIETEREEVGRVVTVEPVPEIIDVGTG